MFGVGVNVMETRSKCHGNPYVWQYSESFQCFKQITLIVDVKFGWMLMSKF